MMNEDAVRGWGVPNGFIQRGRIFWEDLVRGFFERRSIRPGRESQVVILIRQNNCCIGRRPHFYSNISVFG